jgi:hypothetical protein
VYTFIFDFYSTAVVHSLVFSAIIKKSKFIFGVNTSLNSIFKIRSILLIESQINSSSSILGHTTAAPYFDRKQQSKMKSLFVFGVIAVIVTAIQGYSEDDHWKDFKVKLQ